MQQPRYYCQLGHSVASPAETAYHQTSSETEEVSDDNVFLRLSSSSEGSSTPCTATEDGKDKRKKDRSDDASEASEEVCYIR